MSRYLNNTERLQIIPILYLLLLILVGNGRNSLKIPIDTNTHGVIAQNVLLKQKARCEHKICSQDGRKIRHVDINLTILTVNS